MRWSRRLFMIVLLAYPRRTREQRGNDMWITFESHLSDARARGWTAVGGTWRREIAAVWRSGRRARVSARESERAHRERNPPKSGKTHMFDTYWLDFKLGLRMLVKYPGLTLVGGLGMAVAIAISAGSLRSFTRISIRLCHWRTAIASSPSKTGTRKPTTSRVNQFMTS